MGVYDDEDVAARDAREEEEEEEIGQVRRRRRRRRDRGNDAARDIRDDEGCEREGIERARGMRCGKVSWRTRGGGRDAGRAVSTTRGWEDLERGVISETDEREARRARRRTPGSSSARFSRRRVS